MNILFVCTGNTCRSPMAERYLESKKIPDLYVESRGLSADGSPVSQNSAKAMAEKGIDINGDVSRSISSADLVWADKIIYMSPSHFTVLRLYAPESKLLMLGGGISDPFGGDLTVYRNCRDEIFSAIDKLIANDFFTLPQVVQATEQHIKDIAKLEIECFSTPWSEKVILEALNHGTKFFVLQKGENVLGYIGISCVVDEGYITNIAVTENHRGNGFGTALLNRVIALAQDEGLSFISLEVRESNISAISLYKSMGFENEGKRKDFYTNPKENAIIFTKRF